MLEKDTSKTKSCETAISFLGERAAEKLVAAIAFDDSGNGGLLSRATIRAADELRVILLRYHARRSA